MTLEELKQLLASGVQDSEKIKALQQKTVSVPAWSGPKGLEMEYNPRKHPINDRSRYPDVVTDKGIEHVTRASFGLQKLAVKRMTELVTAIPPKRVCKPENDRQKQIAEYLEKIYQKVRINSVNIDRFRKLFAGCEIVTLWYAIEQPNNYYGFNSLLKLRCRTFAPMTGDRLYPLFDEYGDMTALSIGYARTENGKTVNYMDTYLEDLHILWSDADGSMKEVLRENITLMKIPGVYQWREEPIWEDQSNNVYEMEWGVSRNGNYLRKNQKPKLAIFADEIINYGDEKSEDREFKAVMQLPQNGRMEYVTWQQAIDSLKFQNSELRNFFFTQLQLPDWSYEKMSQVAMSGESRKQLFIDAMLKVGDEQGPLLEFLDREVNVVKAFLKTMLPQEYAADIDALQVENIITPYMLQEDKDTINNLMAANGGKAIMSQREAIELYGHSDDVDRTLREIAEQNKQDVFNFSE